MVFRKVVSTNRTLESNAENLNGWNREQPPPPPPPCLYFLLLRVVQGDLPCHFPPVLFQTSAAPSPLQVAIASPSTWDQEVENHVEQGLWKHGACISGFGKASQRFSGYSLYRPFSKPTHSTVRILTPRPHVALHCSGESKTPFSICIKKTTASTSPHWAHSFHLEGCQELIQNTVGLGLTMQGVLLYKQQQ